MHADYDNMTAADFAANMRDVGLSSLSVYNLLVSVGAANADADFEAVMASRFSLAVYEQVFDAARNQRRSRRSS